MHTLLSPDTQIHEPGDDTQSRYPTGKPDGVEKALRSTNLKNAERTSREYGPANFSAEKDTSTTEERTDAQLALYAAEPTNERSYPSRKRDQEGTA